MQAEAYTLQNGLERADRLRGVICDLFQDLQLSNWQAQSSSFMNHIWFTDCKSVYDACMSKRFNKIEDKRLSIEISALRQDLWRAQGFSSGDPDYQDDRPDFPTDVIRWIDTAVMLSDCLTKAMDSSALRSAISSNHWDTSQPLESKEKKSLKAAGRVRSKLAKSKLKLDDPPGEISTDCPSSSDDHSPVDNSEDEVFDSLD